jgi:hypothetical protein
MNNLKLQLSLSIRARYPLIYLVTSEEIRAEEALEEVGRTTGKEVVTWSCSKGFQPPQGDAKKSTQPEEALKYIDASDKKAVFVLKDFHPYLEEQKILRLMRDLVNNLKRSYKTILLVSPVLKIPPELEKDITVHDMPLPDADELGEVLNNLLEPYRKSQKVKVELTKDLQEKVIQATLGLTRNEAENVYAKALGHPRFYWIVYHVVERWWAGQAQGMVEGARWGVQPQSARVRLAGTEGIAHAGGAGVWKKFVRQSHRFRMESASASARRWPDFRFVYRQLRGEYAQGHRACRSDESRRAVAGRN